MKKDRQRRRDAACYATNLVIPKVHLDRNGLQHPSETDIAEAKRNVDDNEQ